jgi:hypothetical protein
MPPGRNLADLAESRFLPGALSKGGVSMVAAPPDLRHVISPAVRDLLELANLDRFDRVRDRIERLRGCTQPVQLAGHTLTLDANTRKVLRSYTTADEPTGRILIPCGNRRASRCAPCSRLYAADTYHLIRAGLSGGKQVPETVREHPRVFATLTAPSFGPVHNGPTSDAGKRLPCRCGVLHSEEDPALGTPVAPDSYDYTGAVLWNAHTGQLWRRFATYLPRKLAAELGWTQAELKEWLRLSFAKVAEYQKRGLVHFHAVIRLDGPAGGTEPPPAEATTDALSNAITEAAAHVALTVDTSATGEHLLRWGDQIDVRPIVAFGTGDLTDEKVAGYIAKYATKGAEDTGTLDRPLYCHACQGRGEHTDEAGLPVECDLCVGTGQSTNLPSLQVAGHVRQMIRTAWDLAHVPELADLKLWKWAHMLGFRGHFSTKSRRYSTTLGALRDARRQWRQAQHGTPRELPDDGAHFTDETEDGNEGTTLVLSHWEFLGIGYSPGESLLAETVRRQRVLTRQLKHEGEIT